MRSSLLYLILLLAPLSGNGQTVTTVAGTGDYGSIGSGVPALNAWLMSPSCVRLGPDGSYYFVQEASNIVRRVLPNDTIVNFIGNGLTGYSGDGGPATGATFNGLKSVMIDDDGNYYVSDHYNHRIRKVDAITGSITTIAGDGQNQTTGDGGPAINASVQYPGRLCIDKNNELLIFSNGIRKIDANGNITTIITLPLTALEGSLSVDSFNNIYVGYWSLVVKFSPTGQVLDTVAGNGTINYTGDNIPATQEGVNAYDMAIDNWGRIFITDGYNHRLRMVENGIITTILGGNTAGYGGDTVATEQALLNMPWGIDIDSCGSIYIADAGNNRIRKMTYPWCHWLNVENNISKKSSLDIFPNPTSTKLTIESNDKITSVRIVDVTGRVVLQRTVNSEQITVDVSGLSAGVYFVRWFDSAHHDSGVVKFVRE